MIYPIKISELVKATGGQLLKGDPDGLIHSFSTDTRTLREGDFFVPVKGDNFDGHDFMKKAASAGAAGVIISKDVEGLENIKTVIKVNDTLEAYLCAASLYLNNFDLIKIGITGSVGKTTAKEMLAQILESKYKVLKPEGSFNNEVGIPQTIFKLEKSHEALVLELAMRGPRQIERLCKYVKPLIGIITVIGEAHFEFMGSYEAIADAKGELFENLPANGLAIINNDDKFAEKLKSRTKARIITYGINNDADFKAYDINDLSSDGMEFKVKTRDDQAYTFKTQLLGLSSVSNLLAIIAAALYLKVPVPEIQENVRSLGRIKQRMEKKILPQKAVLINDCYNASPTSMNAALLFMEKAQAQGKKIAVLADMLELGEIEKVAHYSLGARAAKSGVDFLIFLGLNAQMLKKGALDKGFNEKDIFIAKNNKEAACKLKDIIKEGDLVLLKASRGMKLEEIEEELMK